MITELRRESGDIKKSTRATREGDGTTTLYNLGKNPIISASEVVTISGGATLSAGSYSLDHDSGDLDMTDNTPAAADELKVEFKYANWRDRNWVEAINQGISMLNAKGFFRQTVRQSFVLSAGTRVSSGPSACVDIYEFLRRPTSATYVNHNFNWSYQEDSNQIVLGSVINTATSAARSYLRELQTYASPSATIDLRNAWIEPVKKYALGQYYRYRAGVVAQEGNANVKDGHLLVNNLRAMYKDIDREFEKFIVRAKPTRPAKDMQFHIEGGGLA